MKKIITLGLFLLLVQISNAQCLSGNCVDGFGKYQYESGNTFEGTFKTSKKINGTFIYASGDKYIGDYQDNKRYGQGVFYYKSGNRFEGEFQNGQKYYGSFYYKDGKVYVGYFKDDKKEGYGAMYMTDSRIFKGGWAGDKLVKPNLQSGNDFQIYAVIVGVAEQINPLYSLNYTDDDAMKFYDFLISPSGGLVSPNNIAFLLDRNATKANIINALNNIFSKANPQDEIIFYFSGHGGNGYFVPYDAADGYNLLYHTEVKAAFKKCPAQFKLCIADACHAASIRTRDTEGTKEKALVIEEGDSTKYIKNYEAIKSPRSGVAVLMSSRGSESSLELGYLQQGVFSYYLIKGLDGNADTNRNNLVSIGELYQYIYINVLRDTKNTQHPVLFGQFDVTLPVSTVN
jgi:hypothetical protein